MTAILLSRRMGIVRAGLAFSATALLTGQPLVLVSQAFYSACGVYGMSMLRRSKLGGKTQEKKVDITGTQYDGYLHAFRTAQEAFIITYRHVYTEP